MISLRNISKTFVVKNKVIQAVKDVSLDIEQGEIFGIIGFSGAGKSTLVRCINLLERPTRGEVIVGKKNLTELSQKDLRRARKKIGMIFQHFNLLNSRTVAENIAYPFFNLGFTKKEIDRKIDKLLEMTGMQEKKNVYPSQLSGGQKQRVAIARAIANSPDVLLCDEATSALDPQTTKSILKLIKDLNKKLGITVVIITHEMSVVKEICDRVAVMENGNIVEQGEVIHIFTNPKKQITKDFIDSTSNIQKIEEWLQENNILKYIKSEEFIVKLSYLTKNVSEPLISTASRKFNVDFNIVFANVETIKNATIGNTVAILSGGSEDIVQSIKYLEDNNVKVEVIKNARVS